MYIRPLCVIGAKDQDGNGPMRPGVTYRVSDKAGEDYLRRKLVVEMPRPDPENASDGPLTPSMGVNPPEAQNAPEGPNLAKETNLEEMSYAELKTIAKGMGIEAGKIKSKTGMIEAILEREGLQADELPELTPEDVIE